MNYQNVYNQIIKQAKSQNRKKLKRDSELYIYYEKHHIIPRCLGGGNDKENLVLLTAKEHFICHKLLVEIFPDNHKIFWSYYNMIICSKNKNHKRDYICSSREFERARINCSANMSGSNNHNFGNKEVGIRLGKSNIGRTAWNKGKIGIFAGRNLLNRKHSEETKKKLSEIHKGKKASDETKLKMSKSRKGKIKSEETREKLRIANTGKKKSEETKAKLRIKLICPHCGFGANAGNAKQHHFDNCKHKK